MKTTPTTLKQKREISVEDKTAESHFLTASVRAITRIRDVQPH